MSLTKAVETEFLTINNPLYLVHGESFDSQEDAGPADDTHDIGMIGQYWDGSNLIYTGLFRDATDSTFKLFDLLEDEPIFDTGSVDTGGTNYALASLDLNNLEVFGNLTVQGTTTTINTETITAEDNVITVNSNTASQKEDGGYAFCRIVSNVIAGDTAKESGTASAAGTTTTIELQIANGHGTVLDYYVGWIIDLGGDVTGSAVVTGSTAADPPVLTFDVVASGATSTSTTYNLYNKRYAATIYDESKDEMIVYGFPREDGEGVFDPAGDSGNGNLADYLDFHVNNLTVEGTATIDSLTITDNIFPVNTDESKNDGGFVHCRIPANIVAGDTAKESGTASGAGTTTTILLQAVNGHGTVLDYYKGWIIDLGGDVTGTATVTTSSAADPPVLTLDTAASGATSTSTTYNLYNQHYVGSIYDESKDAVVFYGFPREDGEDNIDPAGDSGDGNLADYTDIIANDITAQNDVTVNNDLTVTGDGSIGGNATVTGDLTVTGVYKGPVNVDDNIFAINTGPTNQLDDGGFVVCRSAANVVAGDTVKESGTASAAGTTTTITLQAANSHGTLLDYYEGWIIDLGGDVTGSAIVTTSTAADPPVLTFDTAATGATTTSTTYNLYNRRYVGTIYDESADEYSLLGFPREDGESPITTTDVNGNLADYLDFHVNNLTIDGTLTGGGSGLKVYITITTGATLTASQILDNDIIYFDPPSNGTDYTLPTITSLSLSAGEAVCTLIVNINSSNNRADILRGGTDLIEDETKYRLRQQWRKFKLIASPAHAGQWIIE